MTQESKAGVVPSAVARLPWRRYTPGLLCAAVGLVFLWRVRAILPPFLIALFLASLLDPVVARLTRRGVSRARAVASIFALAIVMLVLGGVAILPPAIRQVTDLGANITVYAEDFGEAAQRWTKRADRWYDLHHDTLRSLGLDERPSVYVSKRTGPISAAVRDALDGVKNTLVRMLGQVLWLIIIPVSLFYLLLDYPVVRARLARLVPESRRQDVDRMIQEVIEIFGAYVRGLTKVCAMYGASASLLFWILHLQYGLFLGIAAGVFYAVPYIGPALSVVAVAVIALTTTEGIGYTALAVILFVIMHVSFDYGVTPRVVGGSVGLHPLVNIFALMCGVALFGVWGMILAVPVAASVQRLLVHFFPWLAAPPETASGPAQSPP